MHIAYSILVPFRLSAGITALVPVSISFGVLEANRKSQTTSFGEIGKFVFEHSIDSCRIFSTQTPRVWCEQPWVAVLRISRPPFTYSEALGNS
jgi:hypothetical protein